MNISLHATCIPEKDDELLELVNESEEVIGFKKRSEIYADNCTNFRAINAFLVNSSGQLWVPRRTSTKSICPLALDFSVGGHLATGETYDDAFRRETKEELNIDVSKVRNRKLGVLTPHEHGTRAFMMCYVLYSDDAPDFNTEDFIEYMWLSPREIIRMVESGERAKYDLLKVVKTFYV